MKPTNRDCAPVPHKMPTGASVSFLDPNRETARDIATRFFAEKRYAELREVLETLIPLWDSSPTVQFLLAMSLTYEAHMPGQKHRATLLAEATERLRDARALWDRQLGAQDLVDRDATLVQTGAKLLYAWLVRAHGDRNEGDRLVQTRLGEIKASRVWKRIKDPALLECAFCYLILFACLDEDQGAASAIIDMLDEHYPGWSEDKAFIESISAKPQYEFFRNTARWTERVETLVLVGVGDQTQTTATAAPIM